MKKSIVFNLSMLLFTFCNITLAQNINTEELPVLGLYNISDFDPNWLMKVVHYEDCISTVVPDIDGRTSIVDSLELLISSGTDNINDYLYCYLFKNGVAEPDTANTKRLEAALRIDPLNIDANYFLARTYYTRFLRVHNSESKKNEAKLALKYFSRVIISPQEFHWKIIACLINKQLRYYLKEKQDACNCSEYFNFLMGHDFYSPALFYYTDSTKNMLQELEKAYSLMGEFQETLVRNDKMPLSQIDEKKVQILQVAILPSSRSTPTVITLKFNDEEHATLSIKSQSLNRFPSIIESYNEIVYSLESVRNLPCRKSVEYYADLANINFVSKPTFLQDYWPVIEWNGNYPTFPRVHLANQIYSSKTPKEIQDSLKIELDKYDKKQEYYKKENKHSYYSETPFVFIEVLDGEDYHLIGRWNFIEDEDLRQLLVQLLDDCNLPKDVLNLSEISWYTVHKSE